MAIQTIDPTSRSLPAFDLIPGMPRNRETLAAYVNRLRPKGAPTVKGCPAWHDYLDGFGWRIGDWDIAARSTTDGDFIVSWTPEDFGFSYELSILSGERNIVVCQSDPWDLAIDEPPAISRRRPEGARHVCR